MKIAALIIDFVPFEYHGVCYADDDVSVCMFKCILLPILLAGQCYLGEPVAPIIL